MLFLHRKGLEDYDSAQKTYAYTTGTLGTVVSTVNYVYGNTEWGDLLTTYSGKTITYDASVIWHMTGNGRMHGSMVASVCRNRQT